MKRKNLLFFEIIFVFGIFIFSSFVSAGVGIKWGQETALIPESTSTCMTYGVYNPWPRDSYVKIDVSDNLKPILTEAKSEVKYVPAQTASVNSLPVEFCFRTPKVYEKDCLLFGCLICKQDCKESQKVYTGEVILSESPKEAAIGGTGGSSTTMAISAPLQIKVQCKESPRNYSLVFVCVAVVALLLLGVSFLKKKGSVKSKKR